MAAIPPKRTTTPPKVSRQQMSPLQTLLQMGIPKHRAEKALAATGTTDVQLATDWLLSHVNDPLLDDNSPRDYILYACPTGRFLEQLREFWQKSHAECAWNGAHNFLPHITLVSFFKAPDENALHLAQGLQTVMGKQGAMLNEPLKLEAYTSPNFMGFFVAEEHADYLKRIAMQYVKEVSNDIISDTYEHFDALTACFPWCTTTTARCIPRGSRSISLEPHVKSLHLTLAYQFPSTHYNQLKSLVDQLDPIESAGWELRLYSRDPPLNGKQVYKVIVPYSPNECDELELRLGDLVYLNSDAVTSNTDGWIEGTSWSTGLTGLLPASFIERTAESDAWTLHKRIPFIDIADMNPEKTSEVSVQQQQEEEEELKLPAIENMYGDILKMKTVGSENEIWAKNGVNPRRLFLLRHGERVDFTFGTWIPHCFDAAGNYTQKDLNMPRTVPKRATGPGGYNVDTPLTNIGLFQARTVGEALKSNNISIDYAYTSPSYRCVQTCASLLEGWGRKDIKMRLEPGLFEWVYWYSTITLPDWMSVEELAAAGFNMDLEYKPFVSEKELRESTETCDQFYQRNAFVARGALSANPTGNVVLVGHSSTLDVCSRELIGKSPRTQNEMTRLIQKLPYCSMLQVVQLDDKWQIAEPPCPPVTHSANPRFDYKEFLD